MEPSLGICIVQQQLKAKTDTPLARTLAASLFQLQVRGSGMSFDLAPFTRMAFPLHPHAAPHSSPPPISITLEH